MRRPRFDNNINISKSTIIDNMQPKFSTIVINKSTAVTQISASLIMFFFNDTCIINN